MPPVVCRPRFRTISAALPLLVGVAALLGIAAPPEPAPAPRPAAPRPAGEQADAQQPDPVNPRGEPLLYEPASTDVRPRGLAMWAVAVSPDGKTIAATHGNKPTKGEVRLWDRETGKPRRTLAEPHGTRCTAFSPDGKILATGNYDAAIRLYDPETGTLWAVGDPAPGGHKADTGVNGVCFLRGGKYLASAGLDNKVLVWDVAAAAAKRKDGEPVTLAVVAVFEGHTQGVLSVAASDDGLTLLSGSFDRTARAWDVPDPLPAAGEKPVVVKKERVLMKEHANAVEAVAVSPDGQLFATGSWDRQLIVRDRDNGRVVFAGSFQNGVMCVAFSKDGKYLAAGAGQAGVPDRMGEVRVWDVEAKKEVAYRADYPEAVLGVAFTPDGKTVVSTGQDQAVHLWSWAEKDRQTFTQPGLTFTPQPLLAGAISPDGRFLVFSGEGKSVFVFERAETRLVAELTGHADVVPGLAFSPDGKTLATASYDKTVKLWDTATWKERRTVAGHTGWVLGVAFSPDGKTLATGSYDKTVRLWDAQTGEEKATWKDHTAGVRSVAFSPDGTLLASAGSDRIIRVWDVTTGNVRQLLKGHKSAVRSVTFSPDGKTIASGGEDRTVWLWDAASGQELRSVEGLPEMVTAVRFSPKGQSLAVGTFQGPVIVIDPLTGRRRQTLNAHNDAVTGVVFADDAQHLITVSQDRNVRQWTAVKPPTEPAVRTLATAPRLITTAAITPDGQTAVLGGPDGQVMLWDFRAGEAQPLNPPGAAISHVAASAQFVAVVREDGKCSVTPIAPGRPEGWAVPGRFAAFTPDGKHLAVAAGKDAVLYEAATGKEVRRFAGGHSGDVIRLAFSPDGKQLATAGADTKVRLWDAATGAKRQDTPAFGNYATITHLAFSPDGTRLAVAAYGPDSPPPDDMSGNFRVIRQVSVFTVPAPSAPAFAGNPVVFAPQPQDAPITGLAWVAGGQVLVSPAADGTVRLTEVPASGQARETRRFRAHAAAVLAFAMLPDGSGYVTAGEDMAVRRWALPVLAGAVASARIVGPFGGSPIWVGQSDPAGRYFYASSAWDQKLQVFPRFPAPSPIELGGRYRGALAAAFSPDGRTLLTGHESGELIVWDAKSGKELARPAGLRNAVRGIAFTRDGKTFVTVGGFNGKNDEPGDAVVWDAETRTPRLRLEGQRSPFWTVVLSPDDRLAVGGCFDGKILIWEVATGKHVRTLEKHTQGARSVAFSPDGKTMVSGGFDNVLRVWNTDTWEQTRVIELPNSRPSTVRISPDGKEVVTGSRPNVGRPGDMTDCIIYAYRLDDPTAKPRELKGHSGAVLGLTFLNDGKTLVSGGGRDLEYGEVKVWDFVSGKVIGEFRGLRNWVETVAASPDGETVVSAGWAGGRPGELRLWSVGGFRSAAAVPTIKTSYIACADTSPDGKTLVLGASSGGVVAYDMTDPANPVKRKAVEGKQASIRSLAFDAGGKRIVTGDENGKVIVWDAATLEPLREWQATKELAVYRARFTPDGKSVVTAAGKWNNRGQGELRVWDPDTGQETARFPDQSREVWDFVFLDGGKTLVSAQATGGKPGDAAIKVWNYDTRTELRAVDIIAGIRCIAVSPDGKYLAAANHTGQMKVIDTATWQEAFTPPEHGRVVFRLGWSADNKTLYSASEDGTVGVTRVPGGK
jgi:WD40 repeat protein